MNTTHTRDQHRFRTTRHSDRRGTVLVLLVAALIPLMAFCALAIDLGMLAVARTQCQQAADSAAMAGARTLNGDTSNDNNYSLSSPNAQAAATANSVLGSAVQSSQLSLQIGRYIYSTANQRFEGQFPGSSAENWSLVQAKVTGNLAGQLAFSKVLNFTPSNIQATATAVHRPRDVVIILDYSGSMRFSSLMGTPYSGNRTSNNPDTVVPQFGHYSSSSAALSDSTYSLPYYLANITSASTDGRAPIAQDFYQDSGGTPAFSPASSSYMTVPGGDNCLKTNQNAGSSYASTVAGVLNIASPGNSTYDATFEGSGYRAYGMYAAKISGYTQGPGYWGKTFFLWPPDPTTLADGTSADWRKRYFYNYGTATALDDNSRLWDSSGNWKSPGSGKYSINYTAILNFIKNIGPNPFPSRLQSGRIVYYDAIPNSIDTSSFPPTDKNQRFWKDYIDFCLGLVETSSGNWYVTTDTDTGVTGYGTDFTYGTVKITAKSSLSGGTKTPYMHYGDNPPRPRTKFWFGPTTMIDFLGCYNLWYQVNPNASRFCWWPGTCHEAPMYACKLGIRAALNDIKTNHPNDLVSTIMFSTPKSGSSDNSAARFNRVRVGLSRNYTNMIDSLWYPPSTVGNSSATIGPYDADNLEVPRAMGGTCYAMPLMLAYNQFSGNTSLQTYSAGQPTGDAGGNGRKGAQKIIIFETDGAPNTTANASFSNNGSYNSYYNIRYNYSNPGASEYPNGISGYSDNSSTVLSQIYTICNRICASDTASPPGYSSSSKKVQIHCIGFGPVFDPASSTRAAAIDTLDAMQTLGSVSDGMPNYKIIVGDQATVTSLLQQAFTKILQNGLQVSLIQ